MEPTKAPEPTTAPEPTAVPEPVSKFAEAPMLADLVKAGTLPPVDERLPKNPYVIDAPEIGQYGGTWHRGFIGPSDFNGVNRIMNDGLVRFSIDGASVEMKYAESVTPNDDFTEWTINLREGSKWSDGEPFTADDIMFWYTDVVNNKDLTPSLPSWLVNKDGSEVKVEKVDDYSVKFTFAAPQTLFLQEIAQKDYGDKNIPMFLPQHYLKPVPCRHTPTRPTSTRWSPTRGLRRPGPSCSIAKQRPVRQPRSPGDGGLEVRQPHQRSDLHLQAQPVLRGRRQGRQPAPVHGRGRRSSSSPTKRR